MSKQKILFVAAFYAIDAVVILGLFFLFYFAALGLLSLNVISAGFWPLVFAFLIGLFALFWTETRTRVAQSLRKRFFEKQEA